MIIQKMTHISGFYGNESFCCYGAMRTIRPGPVLCLWLDRSYRGLTQISTHRLQSDSSIGDRTSWASVSRMVTRWLSCLTSEQVALHYSM